MNSSGETVPSVDIDVSLKDVPNQRYTTRAMKRVKYGPKPGSTASTFSSMSLKSDWSKYEPPVFSSKPPETERIKDLKRRKMRSDDSSRSRGQPPAFSPESIDESEDKRTSQERHDMLKIFEVKSVDLLKQALASHKRVISDQDYSISKQVQGEELIGDGEAKEAALKIALYVLRSMKEDEHALTLEQSHYGVLELYQRQLKLLLKQKNECLIEELRTQQWPVPLTKIYTKVYLREGRGEINQEHEIRQIEQAFNKRKTPESPSIDSRDIFRPFSDRDTSVRTVLTNGIAGIGKTVLVQKFILDWCEGRAHQDVQLLFPLPFRELNLLRNQRKTLMELLQDFSSGLKESRITDVSQYKVLLILDGLDECRLHLDFTTNYKSTDAATAMPVEALLTNLIKGNLLPNAQLWITTRPAAAGSVPPTLIHRVTEIRGFNNLQKEAYFRKNIQDEDLSRRVISSIRSCPPLYSMCHLPGFCWITANVFVKTSTRTTLTQIFVHFLRYHMMKMQQKYGQDRTRVNKVILSLSKLAFEQLQKGNSILSEEDLKECGLDIKEAVLYSGVCTQVFREDTCRGHKIFCFVHLSVQEFLAALYVHVSFCEDGVNLMEKKQKSSNLPLSHLSLSHLPLSHLHRSAVDRALEDHQGHLDLFLRFLLGLSLESSQSLLTQLHIQGIGCDAESHGQTVGYLQDQISLCPDPHRYINLFHCLNELNEHSLLDEIQTQLDSDQDSVMDQSLPAQWAALNFLLLTSAEKPEELQLKKFCGSEEGLLRLLPAVTASRAAVLNDCSLSYESCGHLSSALSSVSNELLHLNLSDNLLQDSGLERLCEGLKSPLCRLTTLRLNRCGLTAACCESLASVLIQSGLKDLDLSDNNIEDSGLERLCEGLRDPRSQLEALRLSFCNLTEKSCKILSTAVKANPSYLKELDLSYNHLTEKGVELLSEALDEAHCELTKLRVDHNAEHWFKPGLRKYACDLSADMNTAHKQLIFSDDKREVCQGLVEQPYPEHPDRFLYWAQVLLEPGLTSRCYWEVEWSGDWVAIGVTYKSIKRKGMDNGSVMGYNPVSWSLHCSAHEYRAYHNYRSVVVPVPLCGAHGLAVYLDWEAGSLSFYKVSSEKSLTHLHTFNTKFTEPLFPVFRVWGQGSALRLCKVEKE